MKIKYIFMSALLLILSWVVPVSAGVLSTISGTAQIQPMNDASGKYMLKSDGFYCLDENGALTAKPEIHYLDHFEIDGTVFHGYYYHDKNGCFEAGSPRLMAIKKVTADIFEEQPVADTGEITRIPGKITFNGTFRIGNLGKMGGSPRVCYFENQQLEGIVLNGYYYFNENGRLIREPGVYDLKMACNGRMFDGYYYFGGTGGALVTDACVTPDGYPVDENGRLIQPDEVTMDMIQEEIQAMTDSYDGNWCIYVKNLNTEEEFCIADQEMGSASLIKLFVMEGTFYNMKTVLENEAVRMKLTAEDPKVQKKVDDLLWNMITISDNESYNELVRLQTPSYDFKDGAKFLNSYLEEAGYEVTRVRHTLQPSGSKDDGIGGQNVTTVKECGRILEDIYRETCVSPEASREMLRLLSNQTVNWKIRAGLPKDIVAASKSGENSTDQHDVALVYGKNVNYILCVMSEEYGNENTTFDQIRDMSKAVYNYLDMWRSLE